MFWLGQMNPPAYNHEFYGIQIVDLSCDLYQPLPTVAETPQPPKMLPARELSPQENVLFESSTSLKSLPETSIEDYPSTAASLSDLSGSSFDTSIADLPENLSEIFCHEASPPEARLAFLSDRSLPTYEPDFHQNRSRVQKQDSLSDFPFQPRQRGARKRTHTLGALLTFEEHTRSVSREPASAPVPPMTRHYRESLPEVEESFTDFTTPYTPDTLKSPAPYLPGLSRDPSECLPHHVPLPSPSVSFQLEQRYDSDDLDQMEFVLWDWNVPRDVAGCILDFVFTCVECERMRGFYGCDKHGEDLGTIFQCFTCVQRDCCHKFFCVMCSINCEECGKKCCTTCIYDEKSKCTECNPLELRDVLGC